MSPLVPPGDDLPVGSLALWRIEITAQQTRPMCRGGKRMVDTGEYIQLERGIKPSFPVGIQLQMIGGGDIEVGHFDLTPGTVQKREQRSSGPMLPHLLAIRRTESLTPEDAFRNV